MSCEATRAEVPALVGEALEEGARREVEAHLAECQPCRAERDALRGALASLEAWAPPPAGGWEALEAALEAQRPAGEAPEARTVGLTLAGSVAPGTRLGEVTLDRVLDWRGASPRYLARTADEREVVVEVTAADPSARLERELQALSDLHHPRLDAPRAILRHGRLRLAVHDRQPAPDDRTLQERVDAEGVLPWREAVGLGAVLAQALDHAHRQQVRLHDLTADHVVLSRERGARLRVPLPRAAPEALALTASGAMIGTPAHSAPEELRGKATDARADAYRLASVLYFALTGRPPFVAKTSLELIVAKTKQLPDPPSRHAPGLPPELDRILLKGLQPRPEDRYATCQELADALRGLRDPGPQRAGADRMTRRPGRSGQGRRALDAVEVGLLAALACLGVGLLAALALDLALGGCVALALGGALAALALVARAWSSRSDALRGSPHPPHQGGLCIRCWSPIAPGADRCQRCWPPGRVVRVEVVRGPERGARVDLLPLERLTLGGASTSLLRLSDPAAADLEAELVYEDLGELALLVRAGDLLVADEPAAARQPVDDGAELSVGDTRLRITRGEAGP